MSPFTVTSYVRKVHDRSLNVLSVFLHPVPISGELLDEAIAPVLTHRGPFDRVHICGMPESVAATRKVLTENSAARARLQRILPAIDDDLILITWAAPDNTGFTAQTLSHKLIDDLSALVSEQRYSLFDVFLKNGGLVTAGRGTHFTKPSQMHSLQFLRAANVLEQSAVSHQLVFWLYPLLCRRSINRIVVDTSGISQVAYALAYERLRRGAGASLPVIESHASYGGLDDLDVPDPENTIFLISASTSGTLATKLVAKGAEPDSIFTLFYLGGATAGSVLCRLTEDVKGFFPGLPLIKNYPARDCPECKRHSYPIPIVGDQFRTEPAKIEEITVALTDFDESSRSILDRVVSTGLFKVFRSAGNRQFELFLDIDEMFRNSTADESAKARVADIEMRLLRLLRRGTPVHLKRIVSTGYPGTVSIANKILAILPKPIKEGVHLVESQNLLNESAEQDKATLVISAALDDVYELMGISRDLRTVQPGGSITYVSPIFRASSEGERKRIESNLTFGDQGPKTFTLLSVLSINLPHCIAEHSWKIEYDRLKEVEYWLEMRDEVVPQAIIDRIEVLRRAPSVGLVNNLFWPTPLGEPLKLSADFTLIPTQDGKRLVSQADVFAIITSLFHKYRQGVANKPKLAYKTYERTVISPETFERFSDGVLQASFLRAAREGEIAYSNCDEIVSERMLAFLQGEVSSARQTGGHALIEYLIAILVGRLSLHDKHVRAFLREILAADLKSEISVLTRFLQHELVGDIRH